MSQQQPANFTPKVTRPRLKKTQRLALALIAWGAVIAAGLPAFCIENLSATTFADRMLSSVIIFVGSIGFLVCASRLLIARSVEQAEEHGAARAGSPDYPDGAE